MSQAFVKEQDEQWLSDVYLTLGALIQFLTRESHGIRVYEKKTTADKNGRLVHSMSNGLDYAKNEEGKWEVVL